MQEGSPEPSNPIIRHQGDLSITWHCGKQRGTGPGSSVPDTPAKSRCFLAHPEAPAGQSRAKGRTREAAALLCSSRKELLQQTSPAPSLQPIPSSCFAIHSHTDSPGPGISSV